MPSTRSFTTRSTATLSNIQIKNTKKPWIDPGFFDYHFDYVVSTAIEQKTVHERFRKARSEDLFEPEWSIWRVPRLQLKEASSEPFFVKAIPLKVYYASCVSRRYFWLLLVSSKVVIASAAKPQELVLPRRGFFGLAKKQTVRPGHNLEARTFLSLPVLRDDPSGSVLRTGP